MRSRFNVARIPIKIKIKTAKYPIKIKLTLHFLHDSTFTFVPPSAEVIKQYSFRL